MNERIKDLLEEAGLVSYGEDTGFYNIPAPAFLSRIDRLAELIIRECAEFANNHNEEVEGVTLGVGPALKKHFGVKE
jgi:hypothetical protein